MTGEAVEGIVEEESVASAETVSYWCNDATTEATGEDLDILDAYMWDFWTGDLTGCETDADCTASGQVCGDNTIDGMTVAMCVDLDGWCATPDAAAAGETDAPGTYTDGWTGEVYGSTSKYVISC